MATTFDTLTAARGLESAGMDRKQAEAVVGAVRAGQGDLATKANLGTRESRVTVVLYRVALAIVVANAAVTFGIIRLLVNP